MKLFPFLLLSFVIPTLCIPTGLSLTSASEPLYTHSNRHPLIQSLGFQYKETYYNMNLGYGYNWQGDLYAGYTTDMFVED